MIGESAFNELERTFGDRYHEIILRRCSAHGKFINFHTDQSLKTLQLAVNGDDEYAGGRLVFAADGKLLAPARPAGTVTIHHNDIVHAVTVLESGVRYGLFFLKKN
jgi:predicted 2-oxoglutarate/Fe(II)-dependent dioxygenase YbiX